MHNIYYVYAYIRSKDSDTARAGTPYYIGMGSNKRAWRKHKKVPLPKNKVYIKIISNELDWYQAHDLEIRLIRGYGRKDLGTGPLLNRTDGGEGARNHKVSAEGRRRISKAAKGRTPHNKGKKGIQEAWNKGKPGTRLGAKCSEETKEKMRLAAKQRIQKYGPPTSGFKQGNEFWTVREQNRKATMPMNNTSEVGD